jgi:hypothetical protein
LEGVRVGKIHPSRTSWVIDILNHGSVRNLAHYARSTED